jgi:hypothetical protein
MNAFVRKALFSEPTGPFPKWRYVMLAVTLTLILIAGWDDYVTPHSSPYSGHRYVLLFAMLLFGQLTTQYRWSYGVFISLRIVAYVFTLLAFASLCFAR